jgi:hypothetical protein
MDHYGPCKHVLHSSRGYLVGYEMSKLSTTPEQQSEAAALHRRYEVGIMVDANETVAHKQA